MLMLTVNAKLLGILYYFCSGQGSSLRLNLKRNYMSDVIHHECGIAILLSTEIWNLFIRLETVVYSNGKTA